MAPSSKTGREKLLLPVFVVQSVSRRVQCVAGFNLEVSARNIRPVRGRNATLGMLRELLIPNVRFQVVCMATAEVEGMQ
jgi:hypothetical protein